MSPPEIQAYTKFIQCLFSFVKLHGTEFERFVREHRSEDDTKEIIECVECMDLNKQVGFQQQLCLVSKYEKLDLAKCLYSFVKLLHRTEFERLVREQRGEDETKEIMEIMDQLPVPHEYDEAFTNCLTEEDGEEFYPQMNLKMIPDHLKTEELCMKVLENDGYGGMSTDRRVAAAGP